MQKRVALITGGMGGLGETISTKMADAGYRVAVTYSPSNKSSGEWLAQVKGKGCDAGSWDPKLPFPDTQASSGGRLMVTSLSCLTLEVYYRYPPEKLGALP